MPDHAGYAAAVTVRDQVFNDALLSSYHGGQIGHSFNKGFQQLPAPSGSANLYFQAPTAIFSNTDHDHAILRLNGWGTIGLRLNPFPAPFESRTIQWRADLRITATAITLGTTVLLSVPQDQFTLVNWQFDVVTGVPYSSSAQAYLLGPVFRNDLQSWLREEIGDLLFPILDFSFLGPFSGNAFTNIPVKAVNDALVVGFDVAVGDFSTAGDVNQLDDFARDNDVAVVIHPNAVGPLMSSARQDVQDEVDSHGATLESLVVTCEEGRFRITGRASMTGGAANFSLAAVPRMTFSRPGAFLPMPKKTMVVKARTWAALSFAVAEPHVDIDRSDWVILVETIGGVLTLGFLATAIEAFIANIARNITGGIATADLNRNGPTPRVRRIGSPPTRIAIERFEIHAGGVFVGITSRLEAPPAELSGLQSIPRNFVGRLLRYDVRLPFGTLPDDPFLRIRWTVVNLDSGVVLLTDDGLARTRLTLEFLPAALPGQFDRLGVSCRVYRTLGLFVTDLLNETIRLDIGPTLHPGAFIRWRYDVKTPTITHDAVDNEYAYMGDRVVRRWSKFHRADKPCNHAKDPSRYVYDDDVLDDLPFPIHDMKGNRYRLCDYCFFGGPASNVSRL
jgi:hypothetical protein